MKSYADNKHNVKDCKLKIGDTVLVKNKNKGVLILIIQIRNILLLM